MVLTQKPCVVQPHIYDTSCAIRLNCCGLLVFFSWMEGKKMQALKGNVHPTARLSHTAVMCLSEAQTLPQL